MKKLLVLISALAAFSFGSAKADVSVSGTGSVVGQSVGSATNIGVGGSIAFGLSTTLDNGVTVTSSGLSMGIDTDSVDADVNDADAFHQLTFASGSTSLTIGGDVEIDYADAGVGGVAGDDVSKGLGTATSSLTLGNFTGGGFALSTAMGSATVGLGYLYDNDSAANRQDMSASGNEGSTAFKLSMPVGPLSATVAYMVDDSTTKITTTGANVAYALPSGTVKLGYVSVDGSSDGTAMSAAYSTTLGDGTSVAVGYTSTDVDSSATTSDLEVSVSRSIGAGASIFVDMHNRNSVSSGETSAVAVGSSFAF
jgi:hypothetical protein